MGSLWNSLWIGVATTILTTIVSLPLALINARFDYRGKALMSGLLLVPIVMPPFVGALGIQKIFAQYGSLNLLLMEWNIISEPIRWLTEGNHFWVVVILETLHLYPIMYLNIMAALSNIDPSMEEMASTLGVKKWRQFKDITWPLARPGYFAGAIIVFIWAFTDLGVPLLIGFNDTIPVQIFNMVTDVNENPIGFALVFIVVVITVVIFLGSKLFISPNKYAMLTRGHVRNPVKPIQSWLVTLGVYAFMLTVVLLALFPHASVLLISFSGDWFMTVLPSSLTLSHYEAVFQQEITVWGIRNSLYLSALAVLVDLALGVLIAYVIVRKLVPFTSALDSLVMIPLALPGIVLAFGYVVTYTGTFLDPMENPIPLLVIAYAIRRLPFMVRSAVAGLQQMSVSLEEASMTFGASRFYTLRKITVPLVTANLIAGALLCFAYAMLDVSDSLILAMKDVFYPITKVIYVLSLEPGTGMFVASALGMIAMVILSACIIGASVLLGKKMGEIFRG
ncbi:MAG: iron ABC transporter permease [Bradymonadales bacterium]|nr:MAG: iron ABC transporter permease [Bradymonadales bacterium]